MTDDMDWYGPDAATFGDRVAAAREHAGMTQQALAKRLGVRQKTLQAWEDDQSEPRANRLSMLAGVLNVSMMWLMNGEGQGIARNADLESQDLREVLSELRSLRSDMLQKAEAMGRLEKQMRLLLVESADV
jgi:transcriptional regulator with XRE-family HTH domain